MVLLFVSVSFIACGQKDGTKDKAVAGGDANIELISPEALSKANNGIQLIDVRKPEEFSSGHIENAVNMNFYDADFKSQLNSLDKTKEVYLYCRSGGRSGKTAKMMKEMGFEKIYDLEGGMINWEKNSMKVVK
jgi:rhodanese-related sulfurtransferase